MTLVMKFGGSSVADAACMRQVAELVERSLDRSPLVVLSAMGKTTDALFRAARAAVGGRLDAAREDAKAVSARHLDSARALFEGAPPPELEDSLARRFDELDRIFQGLALLGELSPRSMDAIAARGELLSTSLFAAYFRTRSGASEWFDAREVLRTDSAHGGAQPRMELVRSLVRERLAPRLAPGRAVVTQGYIGADESGATTTLGRGGSDWSASILGAALGVGEVQIWTDVEGVYTADPRVVARAEPIADLSFAEAAELAAFGAKVLHPATIQPAVEAAIPVTVRHTQRPGGRFTTIRARTRGRRAVTALATRGPVHVLTVTSSRMLAQSGFLARLFEVFRELDVSVDLVATAEVSVSLTVEADAPLEQLCAQISQFASVEVARDRAIVALVGERVRETPAVPAAALTALSAFGVEMISMGANEINLSVVTRQDAAHDALRALHACFFE
jgi:aspartate kinase